MNPYQTKIDKVIERVSKFSNEYQSNVILKSDLDEIIKLVEMKMEIQNITQQKELIYELQKDIQSLS